MGKARQTDLHSSYLQAKGVACPAAACTDFNTLHTCVQQIRSSADKGQPDAREIQRDLPMCACRCARC